MGDLCDTVGDPVAALVPFAAAYAIHTLGPIGDDAVVTIDVHVGHLRNARRLVDQAAIDHSRARLEFPPDAAAVVDRTRGGTMGVSDPRRAMAIRNLSALRRQYQRRTVDTHDRDHAAGNNVWIGQIIAVLEDLI